MALAEKEHVLVVDDDEVLRALVGTTLEREGYRVSYAADGAQALSLVEADVPALVVSDVNMPGTDGFAMLERLRTDPRTAWLPVLMLTSRREVDDVVHGLSLGADDYLPKPFSPSELVARVRSKLDRPPVPVEFFPVDRDTGLLSLGRFEEEVAREFHRAELTRRGGALVILGLSEIKGIELRLGKRLAHTVVRSVAASLLRGLLPLDRAGRIDGESIGILMPETTPEEASARLGAAMRAIAHQTIEIDDERIRVTPSAGLVPFQDAPDIEAAMERARIALDYATAELDLQPRRWDARIDAIVLERRRLAATNRPARTLPLARLRRRLLTFSEFAITVVVALVAPFMAYVWLDRAGHDPTPIVYLVTVISLVVTAALIWVECLLSLRRDHPPEQPGQPYPPATAIVAAYLPNEAGTIIETVEAFLRLDYPAPLQVILAYNTSSPLPVEAALREIAAANPRLVVERVEGSTSKAQNVNSGLSLATGRFVGVFDADHQPEPDAFRRAWRWLSHGYDVVQGHCLVRNGGVGFVARMVAVEFEAIYAVSHPGRARLHDFGIFGGSNGFWRTDLLHGIRMRGTMLTEDIDSSLRVLEAGGRVRVDPGLVSRELGTTTLKQVWNQRMRWSQGWFQVSKQHLVSGMRSKLSIRQKFGLLHLLGWREIYPWLSVQVLPVVAFWIYRGDALDWIVPIFVLTSLFTLSVGPAQTFFAYRNADPEIKRRKRWFLQYFFFSSLFYTEYKNVIARIAQVKEVLGDRDWRVTPRAKQAKEDS